MPSALSTVQKAAQATATDIMSKSPESITTLNRAFDEHFSVTSLTSMRQSYTNGGDKTLQHNDALVAALSTTMDATYSMECDLAVVEQYVTLLLPKMEDGNNFGVTIQLQILKSLQDLKEKIEKGLEDLSKYASTRAEAMDKCPAMTTSSTTTTATKTESSSEGTDKEKGAVATTNKGTSKEEKTVSTVTDSPMLAYRKKAIVDCDVLYYAKARSLFVTAMTGYLGILDFIAKNKEKIEKPKGSQGTGGYTGMY